MKHSYGTKFYTHKIVHSSAMYYYNLNVICKGSKKLLTIKNSKKFFLTPSTIRYALEKIICAS